MSTDNHIPQITGLTDDQVAEAARTYGYNRLVTKKSNRFLDILKDLGQEPMIILLLIAASVYFFSGSAQDGFFMVAAIVLISIISLYHGARSRKALEKIKELSTPWCKVIRNGTVMQLPTDGLVMGDCFIIEEGNSVPVDGTVIYANDLSVNESILTGESLPVFKDETSENAVVYQGTTVTSGRATAIATAIGNATELGKIGASIEHISKEKTPLELQINNFLKKMTGVGVIAFFIVWGINYERSGGLLNSLLKALTLAMSILPEEISVAFTTFMALGAWRLLSAGVLVKQLKTVETLGGATVICVDKTGTITENRMSIAQLYLASSNTFYDPTMLQDNAAVRELISTGMWASEPTPYDLMEVAIHQLYSSTTALDERPNYELVQEYPLNGKPPMTTHIYKGSSGAFVTAAKGAPEALMNVSSLSDEEKQMVEHAVATMSKNGYRVLGVGAGYLTEDIYPKEQQSIQFRFIGLIAFHDPPKGNIGEVIKAFYKAGISVKIITGDNTGTTVSIARQIGFKGYENSLAGSDLMNVPESDLPGVVSNTNIFTRMFPEAKLKIINALKSKKEIVAMTGDGVNDGPALMAAHVGVAMGKRGTEIARQAASLILLEDDLSKMVDAIAIGRRIQTNLKKAIRYTISIHIPIILTVLIPLFLGWIHPNIFLPAHVIFLELIMGPTCSIIYENEPIEKDAMSRAPRRFSANFFNSKELWMSITQGLMITLGNLLCYQYAINQGYDELQTRTLVFAALITANIVLTLVNRSFVFSVFTNLNVNKLVLLVISITIGIAALIFYCDPVTRFFKLERLRFSQLAIGILTGALSVIWYEVVKWHGRRRQL